jgi:3-hydroxyisobutyrate dehydrogenase-like beta-hydroxyacid dehydrogenase
MTRIGVIGLGNIGGAIARNLVADGDEVLAVDSDRDRVDAIEGATASDIDSLAASGALTITSLPTPEVVADVARTWAAAAPGGSVLVDISTSAPEGNRALADELAALGHHFVEAPLTGGAIGAENRSLVFMVGGEDEAVARCRPVLDRLGRATFHLGPVGAGSTMKLVNSLLAFACTLVSLEGLSLAAAAGLDLRTVVEVIRTGGATNFYIDRAVEGIDQRGRPPQFALALAAKDAELIGSVADHAGVPAPIAAAVRDSLADALRRGLGGHDWSDLVVAAEARGGVELRLGPGAGGA